LVIKSNQIEQEEGRGCKWELKRRAEEKTSKRRQRKKRKKTKEDDAMAEKDPKIRTC